MELQDLKLSQSSGNIIYAKIVSSKKELLLNQFADNITDKNKIKTYLKNISITSEKNISEFVNINSQYYVYLNQSLNKAGDQLSIIFKSSRSLKSQLFKRLILSICFVILIVFLTTIILYLVIMHLTNKLVRTSADLLDANMESLELLGSAIAQRYSDNHAHNFRVTLLSIALTKAKKLPHYQIRTLITGAFLHDVGKIGISDNILLKPGKLTDAEFNIMKTHVNFGVEIIKDSVWLSDANEVVSCHHEKFDGRGYPNSLRGENIPLNTRLIAIADVFDALVSERPYKKAFSFDKAMSSKIPSYLNQKKSFNLLIF